MGCVTAGGFCIKQLPRSGEGLGSEAGAGIGHTQDEILFFFCNQQCDSAAAGRIAHGVVQQVFGSPEQVALRRAQCPLPLLVQHKLHPGRCAEGAGCFRQFTDKGVTGKGFPCGGRCTGGAQGGQILLGTVRAAQYGTRPDLCVYAGVPAAMFLANADPEADLAVMRAARENIRQIAPKRLVLISSIAVLADSRGVYEDSPAQDTEGLPAYGKNRLQLERWVREDFPDALIVRLPALYGTGIRKNFLFDLHTITPAMLRPEKYSELAAKSPLVKSAYTLADNGFYKLNGTADPAALRAFFAANDFNALAFTDARSRYQFYNLGRLWSDMEAARAADVKLLHLCTPPVSAAEVYTAVTGKTDWHNELPKPPFDYDLRSRHAALLGGSGDYLCTKQQELDDITRFMRSWRD